MRNLLQKLPFPVEFAVVVAGAIGLAFVYGVLGHLHLDFGTAPGDTQTALWRTIGVEAVTLVLLGVFLRARGWTFTRLGLVSHWSDGLWGVALAAGFYIALYLIFQLLIVAVPGLSAMLAAQSDVPEKLPLPLVGAIVLVSSFYQEVFLTGYVVAALKEKGFDQLAVNASVALRVMYYIYLGPLSLIVIIARGLIFSIWFSRTGRLWPVVVAQAVIALVKYSYCFT